MRSGLLTLVLLAAFSANVSANEKPQPKYPQSFDCSAVPAGSQRQACNRSQLNPPMGEIPEATRPKPPSATREPQPQRLPTEPPPTIPRLPGTINNSN